MLTYVPILVAVASMPVNVFGFGPVQGAWLVFSPWAPSTQILAFQFLWNLMQMTGQVVRGAPFVRGVIADLSRREEVEPVVAKVLVDRQTEGAPAEVSAPE